jgi:uncharacterized protein (TIGR03437 family)
MYWRAWLLTLLALPPALAQTASDLFDESVFHEIRLTINPKDWKTLQDNYLDNTYYPANFTWRGKTVENIGIRSKGRTSRRPNKPGLRVDFNQFEDGQEFLGLKSVLLDSNIQDLTLIKERLTMRIFEMMGIPAPRETNTRLFVNDEYIGVYTIVESTDKTFLKDRLAENDGYLYEYVTTSGYRFQWKGDDPALYSPNMFKPETHEKDPDPKPVMEMVRAINSPGTDAEWLGRVSEYLDVKKFLTHLAVEMFVAEFDGILADDGMANFYFYRFEKKNLGMFLPKDKDLAFNLIEYLPLKNLNDNSLTKRAMAIPEMKEHLTREILRAADLVSGEGGWLQTQINRDYAQIRDAMLQDKNKECLTATSCPLEQSNTDFEKSIEYIKRFALERKPELVRQLTAAGYPVPADMGPVIVSGAAVNAATNAAGPVAPGSLVALYGRNLATATATAAAPWPPTLAGAQVLVNNVAAPIYYSSATQINFQIPWETPAGTATIQSQVAGLRSESISISVTSASPGIFAIVNNADGTVVSAANPASTGGYIILYVNGLGDVTNRPSTGAAAAADPLSWTIEKPSLTVGSLNANVVFWGLAPGYVGLYQLNAQVPVLPTSPASGVIVSVSGLSSPPVNISIR